MKIREERDSDKTYKRQRDLAFKKFGHMQSSLGFAGANILGMTGDIELPFQRRRQDELERERRGNEYYNTESSLKATSTRPMVKPAGYMMQSQGDPNMTATIYDDTGRGMQTLKVQRLLDKAKQVIAYENKKLQKEQRKALEGNVPKRKRFADLTGN